jgi:hypothetical protein
MRKTTLANVASLGCVLLFLAAGPTYAALGDVVSSFPCEGNITQLGATWDGSHVVMTNNHAAGDHRWRVYSTAGSWLSSFPAPVTSAQYGCAYLGRGRYWGGSQTTDTIYLFETTGSAVSSFPAADPYGITWDGTYLWWLGADDVFRQCDSSGSVIRTFTASPITNGRDLGWDGRYLWCPDSTLDYVYSLTTDGSIVASFRAPGGLTYGCAYDGEYLWVTDIGTPRYAYRIDLGYTNVAPASFGKIKATFR